MSTVDFFKNILEKDKDKLDKVRELQRILDQFEREKKEVYIFSITHDN